ncbi:MAG: hypothetical protein ACIAQZ_10280 [Sedimentisphaeraceae bacterium JB056]
MAYRKDEKTLHADISGEIFQKLKEQCSNRSQVMKGAVEASIRVWLQLPSHIQFRLLDRENENCDLMKMLRDHFEQSEN